MSYTIKDLKEEIANLPDDMEVWHQSDPEGNSFSPCAGIDADAIVVGKGRDSIVYDTKWTAIDADMTEKQWDKMLKKPRVAILFPSY